MYCSQCGTESRPDAKFCGHCGASLAAPSLPASGLTDDLSRLQANLGQQIDDMMGAIGRDMASLLSPTTTPPLPSPVPPPVSPPGASSPGLRLTGAKSLLHEQQWRDLLVPREDHVRQAANFVLDSAFVQGNPSYQRRAIETTFVFLSDNPKVNAFATDAPLPLEKGGELKPPVIVFFGGLAVAIRLATAALAVHLRSKSRGLTTLKETFGSLGKAIECSQGSIDLDASVKIFLESVAPRVPDGDERFVSLARSYAAAADMCVVAHEAGHIALGHTLARDLNFDISRNQEREADSFASSALSTSPFPEYLFLGQVLVTTILAWYEHATGMRKASSHPLAGERFFNALQSNSQAAEEAAEAFGLSRERLVELLPGQFQKTR